MKNNILNNRRLNKAVSIFLSFILIFPNMAAIAEGSQASKKTQETTITVTIEDHTTGEIIQVPKQQLENESVYATDALKRAFEDGEIETFFDNNFNTSIKSVTTPDGRKIENDDENNWNVFIESQEAEDLLFARVHPNEVVRLIYSNKNEDQPSMDGNQLAVNKDKLIAKLGEVTSADQEDIEVEKAYQQGLAMLFDSDIGSSEIEEFVNQLDDLLNPVILPEHLEIKPQSAELAIGETISLKAKITPENATGEVEWESENPYVAVVDENGNVTGRAAGEVNIVAKIGDVQAKTKITVKEIPAEKIYFEEESLNIYQGENKRLNLITEPENTTDKITLTSSDEEIVEVSQAGAVVGKNTGQATIRAQVGSLTTSVEIKVEERFEYTEPTVIFESENGEIKEANEADEFILSPLDKGKFVLKGAEDIDFIDGEPYWDGAQAITEGNINKTNIWIFADGTYQPHKPQTITAKVLESSPHTGDGKLIKEFKIKTVPTDIVELKGYIDGEEIDTAYPYSLAGSESKRIAIKGRRQGSETYVDIPVQALSYAETGEGYGYITNGEFGMYTDFDLPEGAQAKYKIQMVDEQAEFNFAVISERINLTDFKVSVPKVAYIDKWNNLGGQYIGLLPHKSVNPGNATNAKLNWKSLTPEIAEYIPQHNNGIVPKKAGLAKFEVRSDDNPALVQEVVVEFKYKNPLILAIVEEDITLEKYSDMKLPIKISPENATEKRFNWSFSKEGIVDIEQRVYQENTSNVNNEIITEHKLVAKEVGTVIVTGTPIDDTSGAKPVQFKVTVTPAMTEDNVEYLDLAVKNKEHGIKYLKTQSVSTYGDEWNIFSLSRAGVKIPAESLEDYVTDIIALLDGNSRLVPTDFARILLALEAAGYNANNIGGHNLFEKLYTNESLQNYSGNHTMWTLIALDSKAHEIPKDAEWTREKLIENILQHQATDGSFSLSKGESTGSIDITAMAIQSLAPYYENSTREDIAAEVSPELKEEVNRVVAQAVNFLSTAMTLDAGFIEQGAENSNSVAQVLTALSSIQIDITENKAFVKGNKTMLTNIEKFKLDTGYSYMEKQKVNNMATVQVVYSLNAFERFVKGEKSLYDLTDSTSEDVKPEIPNKPDESGNGSSSSSGSNGSNESNESNNSDSSVGSAGNSSDKIDNGNEVEAEAETKAEKAEDSDDFILPKTGDAESSIWLSIFLISSGSTAIFYKRRKKV